MLPESREVGLPNFIVLGESHENADAPHPITLLPLVRREAISPLRYPEAR